MNQTISSQKDMEYWGEPLEAMQIYFSGIINKTVIKG